MPGHTAMPDAARLEPRYFLSLDACGTTKFGIPYVTDTRYTRFTRTSHVII
jgi:hypothetical protein